MYTSEAFFTWRWIMFFELELQKKGFRIATERLVNHIFPDQDVLVPCIAQDVDTQQVLMMAWMNLPAYQKTMSSGRLTFFSRKRKKLWTKGETSGHYLEVKHLYIDCDGDTLLAKVHSVANNACHTYRPSCFYLEIKNHEASILQDPGIL